MKKVFSLLLASVLTMSMFAQTKTVATVEKLWSRTVADLGSTMADSRQGAGYNGKIYILNKANHSLVAVSQNAKDTIFKENVYVRTDTIPNGQMVVTKKDSTLVDEVWQFTYDTTYTDKIEDIYIKFDGTAFALDDAGNFVMEGTFPNTPSHLVVRKADGSVINDLPITGLARTDFLNATGDVFSAEGGYVFIYGNSASGLLVYKLVNGAIVDTKTVAVAGVGGGNYVIAGNDSVQIVHHRSSEAGWVRIVNGVATTIENMEGFKKTTLGGDIISLSGKELYIYPAGSTNYNSQFSVRNMTDGALVGDKADASQTIFYANTTDKNPGATSTANWLIATPIDANNAYIHLYNAADGAALFKLSVTIAAEVTLSCDTLQGTVTGGGDIAVGANATVKAVAKPGFEFVAWKKGEEVVSNSATYTFAVTEHVALTAVFEAKPNVTLTLAVNDAAKGAITLPAGIVMGANSVVYGTPVELTAVPVNGKAFYGWYEGETLYSEDAQIVLNGKATISLTAKFVDILPMAYELNGGVANTYGWINASTMFASFMEDSEAKAGYKTLEEFLAMPEKLGDPGICTYLVTPEKAFADTVKWNWLKTYIESVHIAQAGDGASTLPANGAGAAWRYAIGAFFIDGQRTGWPKSANFTTCGVSTLAAYQPVWKGAFANPTEVVKDFALNTPYREGYTFDGWYADSLFTGTKVQSVNYESNIPGGKLYAKWIEYIPTIAEAIAQPQKATVKTGGVVTFIRGTKNVYVQDATGGILVYTSDNATCKVGDNVIINGKNTTYGGAPEIGNAAITVRESGVALPKEQNLTLAALVADTALKYFAQRVLVEGVNIAKYDNNGNVYVTDGIDTVQCYYVTPNQTTLPVGTKVNLHLIAAYFNKFQFVGPNDGVQIASASGVDSYAYPALGENGVYTLTNKWIFSNKEDNFSDNKPAVDDHARGMVAKDGKLYFIDNNGGAPAVMGNGRLVVVDGATGTMLNPINITGDHLFETPDSAGNYNLCATLSYNDIKLDNAGNCLIGGCVSGGNRMQVYKLDMATGAATTLIDERLYDNEEWGAELAASATAWRFDAFNVYGDINNHAIVMAADANSWMVYKWEINNGVAEGAERIDCTPEGTETSLLVKDGAPAYTAFGTAPQIFPVDFDYFYVDGWNTLPTLFNMEGTIMEDFAACPTGTNVIMGNDTCKMNTGHNGLCEFQIGDEYFLVMAATNTVGKPTSAFAVYKFADAAKSFAGLEPMWYFPHNGMGEATNGCRTAVPYVEVNGTTANIYVYTNNNGYGMYQMTGKEGTGIKYVEEAVKAIKVIENGHVYIIRDGVRYTVLGAQVK